MLQANPPQFDRAEDLAHLRYLNESSILHTLRQRYGSNLIHTYAGGSMVVINPMAPLAIHSEKVSLICLNIRFVPNTNINNAYSIGSLFCVTNIVCHFLPLFRCV
jgi:Myosin heavy chain